MHRAAYLDLYRMLRRFEPEDERALQAEFGAGARQPPERARVEALRAMMPSVLRRVLTGGDKPRADRLVRAVALAPSRGVIRPLLAVLVLAPDLSVRTETVENVLIEIGDDAIEPVLEALKGLSAFSHTPLRVIASLARVAARIGDPRAVDAIMACLQAGAHGQGALLGALRLVGERCGREEQVRAFVAKRASNTEHAIEKGLWPRSGRGRISPLRVRLLRGRYARAMRRWPSVPQVPQC